eukprot:TRINITY_DN39078_c0_g1_i1.p1 TRINITY_DN39078_c0_g1~~TRINITY_DN39078_c0_g1_i1.p1  ORF type:complete len:640 (-),score=62.90 TRINITY_DN39078_c0_g1_i1:445-2364(-)
MGRAKKGDPASKRRPAIEIEEPSSPVRKRYRSIRDLLQSEDWRGDENHLDESSRCSSVVVNPIVVSGAPLDTVPEKIADHPSNAGPLSISVIQLSDNDSDIQLDEGLEKAEGQPVRSHHCQERAGPEQSKSDFPQNGAVSRCTAVQAWTAKIREGERNRNGCVVGDRDPRETAGAVKPSDRDSCMLAVKESTLTGIAKAQGRAGPSQEYSTIPPSTPPLDPSLSTQAHPPIPHLVPSTSSIPSSSPSPEPLPSQDTPSSVSSDRSALSPPHGTVPMSHETEMLSPRRKSLCYGAPKSSNPHRIRASPKEEKGSPHSSSVCDKDSEYYAGVDCQRCGQGDNDDKMLLCDKCDDGYHMFCMQPVMVTVPAGSWFCPNCTTAVPVQEFPLVQTSILKYFKIVHPILPCYGGRKRRKSGLTIGKKLRSIQVHLPSPDVDRRYRQMQSLASALTTVGAEYANDLKYTLGVPESANSAGREAGGMQVMRPDDLAAYDTCRAMWARGEWPPLMVRHDSRQGFVVEADAPIADMTFIAEYTGEVDTMAQREGDDVGDSLMALLLTGRPETELVICPNRFANHARFISGINNSSRDGRKKMNVRCVRFNIRGQSHALLVAIRDIRNGERLYYDYNGLESDGYPTENFD